MNNILFIDTALQATVTGLQTHSDSHETILSTARGHAERLIPLIDDMMKNADVEYQDLDAIITTLGPGSFTGLRVGITVAKSMGLSLSTPVQGISTLDAISISAAINEPHAVILESKRKDFYVQIYGADTPFKNPSCATANILLKTLQTENIEHITGDGVERFQQEIEELGSDVKQNTLKCDIVSPKVILKAFQSSENVAIFKTSITPIYVRDADVSISKKPQRRLASDK